MNIRGFNIYEYYINKFVEKCKPSGKFRLVFLAISPPLSKVECEDYDNVYCYYKYFYNYRCRDGLRDKVFARVFLGAKLGEDYKERRELLCKLTRCGIILLDLVYFPTTQSILSRMLMGNEGEGRSLEEAIISYTVNNILELRSHDTHVIILYNKKDNRIRLMKILDKIKEQIEPHVKQVHEIQDFFTGKYSEKHVEKIREKVKEALGDSGYKEIVECVKGSNG